VGVGEERDDLRERAEESTVDTWVVAGLPGPVRHANYLVGPLAAQYRLIVGVLLDAQEHSLTGVARVELPVLLEAAAADLVGGSVSAPLLAADVFDLDSRMAQLQRWGVVESWQDAAESEADFLRNRERYQLTPAAAALHRFVRSTEAAGATGSTAALLAPAVVAARLDEVVEGIGSESFDSAAQAWATVEVTVRDMAAAAAGWQSQMAAALAGSPDASKVETLRATVLAYAEVWGSGVDVHSPRITSLLERLAGVGEAAWRRLALERLGADAGTDAVDAEVEGHRETERTLRRWFDGAGSQGAALRRQVRDVIGPLLRSHRALLQVGGAATRRGELLSLAARVERAPSDAEAWALWCESTGLFGARHLSLASPAESEVGRHTSFWSAPPVPVEARLRAQGPRSRTGRPARIPDRSTAKATARARLAAERRRRAEAEARLRDRSGTALSTWGELDDAEFEVLLELFDAARGRSSRTRTGVTVDGRWEVRLTPSGAGSAEIRTRDGSFVCADVVMELSPPQGGGTVAATRGGDGSAP
jgi:uncharacterized protein (TIGR02677 family)